MTNKTLAVTADTARTLFDDLRHNILATEQTIHNIIKTKAWEPLGYASLTEAWAAEMKGVRLASTIEANLLYAMFEQGTSINDAAFAVHGVGPKKAAAYHQAQQAGMTPNQASIHAATMSRTRTADAGGTYVQSHRRRPATKRNAITMQGFTDEEIKTWKDLATAQDMTVGEWARDVFRNALTWGMNNDDAA